jgi:hypothetical protein
MSTPTNCQPSAAAIHYIKKGEFRNGLEAINKSIQLSPGEVEYKFERGFVLGCLGKYEESIKDLEVYTNSENPQRPRSKKNQ